MTDTSSRRVRLAHPTFPDLDPAALMAVLGSGWLSNGGQVRAFEAAFAEMQSAPHAVAVSSCSAALHLALLGHGVGPGDEVITSPFTFAATANAIVHAGATPVLADVDEATLNIDPERLAAAITPRTRAVIPVHFAGLPVDLDAIAALKAKHGFALIQDAAHATEARWGGQALGAYPDTACFSFYATKTLPIGEGGMLTTHDPAVADAARRLRNHGMNADAFQRHDESTERWRHWDMPSPGFNYKMTEIAAALGLGQLPHVEGWRARRAASVARYEARLAAIPGVRVSATRDDATHAHHLFVIRLERDDVERDVLAAQLRAAGVEVSINYRPIHDLTWYRETYRWTPADFPVASRAGARCITLPLHPELSEDDIDFVADTLATLLPA